MSLPNVSGSRLGYDPDQPGQKEADISAVLTTHMFLPLRLLCPEELVYIGTEQGGLWGR